MADSITANFHWVKPEIAGSPTTWGNKLNADLDLIDNQLFTTTTAGTAAQSAADAAQASADAAQTSADAAQTSADAAATAANVNIPIGAMIMWPLLAPPLNYFVCDGAVYNISDAPILGALLGATWDGDGTTTFGVPNLCRSAPIGWNPGDPVWTAFPTEVDQALAPGADYAFITLNYIIRYK